jgi:hypothetical protein
MRVKEYWSHLWPLSPTSHILVPLEQPAYSSPIPSPQQNSAQQWNCSEFYGFLNQFNHIYTFLHNIWFSCGFREVWAQGFMLAGAMPPAPWFSFWETFTISRTLLNLISICWKNEWMATQEAQPFPFTPYWNQQHCLHY